MPDPRYLHSTSGRLLKLALAIAFAGAALISMPGARPYSLTVIAVTPLLCVVPALFSIAFAAMEFPKAVVPLIVGGALAPGLLPAALSSLVERGPLLGIVTFVPSVVLFVSAIAGSELLHPHAHAPSEGRP